MGVKVIQRWRGSGGNVHLLVSFLLLNWFSGSLSKLTAVAKLWDDRLVTINSAIWNSQLQQWCWISINSQRRENTGEVGELYKSFRWQFVHLAASYQYGLQTTNCDAMSSSMLSLYKIRHWSSDRDLVMTFTANADYAVARCLSVYLSVCLLHVGILLKRLNTSSYLFSSSDSHTILVSQHSLTHPLLRLTSWGS